MKVFVLCLIVMGAIYKFIGNYLEERSLKYSNARTQDIYDDMSYKNFQAYRKELASVNKSKVLIESIVIILLLIFNVFGRYYDVLMSITNHQGYILLAFIVGIVIYDLPFALYFDIKKNYMIENKYGFGKYTLKKYLKDYIIGIINSVIILYLITFGILYLYQHYQANFVFIALPSFIVVICIFTFLMPVIKFNKKKLIKIPEGALKEKIENYFKKVDFPIHRIFIFKASENTTKVNAFFGGLGRLKRVVIYDTLLQKFTDDEIISVIAHEVGHYKHKDFYKNLIMAIAMMTIFFGLIYGLLSYDMDSKDFGFSQPYIGFIVLLATIIFSTLLELTSIVRNFFLRKIEYKADAYGAKTYDKDHSISALKKIAKANYANLNPHPFNVFTKFSHPPIFARIDAIKGLKQNHDI